MQKAELLQAISLRGLEARPAQEVGALRLVPLVRRGAPGDLRIAARALGGDLAIADVGCAVYASYIPHALVVGFTADGTRAAWGTQLTTTEGKAPGARNVDLGYLTVDVLHRMAKREGDDRVRLLPLHLAMEGLLALHFAGPSVTYQEYARHALRVGLSPRVERSFSGRGIEGLADALRMFEIHDDQVGVLVFASDALASAFVVSHPDDYRALHPTLLADFFGDLVSRYAEMAAVTPLDGFGDATPPVADVADLAAAIRAAREEQGAFAREMASGLLARDLVSTRVQRMGPFSLQRFITQLSLDRENHIGEAIVRADGSGTIEYLKTFRLSAAQTRRAYLLSELARCGWSVDATAAALKTTRDDLIVRVVECGFAVLFKPDAIAKAYAAARPGKRPP